MDDNQCPRLLSREDMKSSNTLWSDKKGRYRSNLNKKGEPRLDFEVDSNSLHFHYKGGKYHYMDGKFYDKNKNMLSKSLRKQLSQDTEFQRALSKGKGLIR